MLVIVPSGSRYCIDGGCGTYFWGAHEHDGIWHLALIESAFKTVPFTFPVLAGQALGGYNYLIDIILYLFTFMGMSASVLYFKIQPIVWFGVFSFLLYRAGRLVRVERDYIRWLFFFVYFSTSFGILIQWFKHQTLSGSVGIPTMQGALSMTNPQFMWSLCILLGIWIITREGKGTVYLGLLVFIGLGLKFYCIIPASIMICWYICELFVSKQMKKAVIIMISVSMGISMAYVMFYMGGAPGGLVWKPLEIPHQMIEDKNLWYDQVMVQERYYIQQLGHMWSPKLWWIEIRTVIYFIFFNFGIRLVGVIGVALMAIFNMRNTRRFLSIILAIIACTVMPILFIQRGTWWNSIQFLYYAIFFASILTAEFVWQYTHKRNIVWAVGVAIICIALFLPTNVEIVKLFSSRNNVSYIPDEEMHALQSLRTLPYGVVLTQAFSTGDANILANNYDTAYVSAYSGKPVYVADQAQLELLGTDYKKKLATLQDAPCSLLPEVQYVYIRLNAKDQKIQKCTELPMEFIPVYKNTMVSVWRRL